jgi:hypothetical protein
MLKYTESGPYIRDKHPIHFILIAASLLVIAIGWIIYFYC